MLTVHVVQVTIILAGYQGDIHAKLYRYNIGMARRFIDVPFTDFDVDQLHEIFSSMLKETGWGADAGVARVAARRVARGIGGKHFGTSFAAALACFAHNQAKTISGRLCTHRSFCCFHRRKRWRRAQGVQPSSGACKAGIL